MLTTKEPPNGIQSLMKPTKEDILQYCLDNAPPGFKTPLRWVDCRSCPSLNITWTTKEYLSTTDTEVSILLDVDQLYSYLNLESALIPTKQIKQYLTQLEVLSKFLTDLETFFNTKE